MKWFEGNIPDAINVAKSKGSLFVVYIYGEDEMSQQMTASWESQEVTEAAKDIVAVKIHGSSDNCKHFSQIYPVIMIPATFCIGENGVPLEVVGGPLKPQELVTKLAQVKELHTEQKLSLGKLPATKPGESTTTAPGEVTEATVEKETSARASSSMTASAPSDSASKPPVEEKIERARELIEQKRDEKAQKEFEKSREEEIKRRKLGHDLHKLKASQEEMKMKEIREQMKKDKDEEKKAKERIRQQIARDREERQARYQKEKEDREKVQDDQRREKLLKQQTEAMAEEARKSETARIQVRLPDGSSMTQTFPSTDPLRSLHAAVIERLGGSDIILQQAYPKRRFGDEHMELTFTDLQLAPSAVLIALPAGGQRSTSSGASSSSAVQPGGGGIISLLLSPFLWLFNFVYTLLFRGGNSGSQQRSPVSPSSPTDDAPQTSTRPARPNTAYQRRTAPGRDGNMRRMADLRDDDDDMSTYNGNSTQQL